MHIGFDFLCVCIPATVGSAQALAVHEDLGLPVNAVEVQQEVGGVLQAVPLGRQLEQPPVPHAEDSYVVGGWHPCTHIPNTSKVDTRGSGSCDIFLRSPARVLRKYSALEQHFHEEVAARCHAPYLLL